jgi:hypothetical protein
MSMTIALRHVAAAAVIVLVLSSISVRPARGSVLSGCVAPEDAGVSHLVGWVDVGVMLGVAEPVPPASLRVTAPDGSVVDYRDGIGLLTPTDALPIWFAPAPLVGDYELVIDGDERCTLSVHDGSDGPLTVVDEIELDWVPRSAPAKGN